MIQQIDSKGEFELDGLVSEPMLLTTIIYTPS